MRFLKWVKVEILHIFPIFIFFLISFTIINWTETLLFIKAGIVPFSFWSVVIAAALIAKIVFVIDHLSLINFFRSFAMAYVILWKTIIYWLALLLVRFCIRLAPLLWRKEGVQALFEEIEWNLFFSIQFFYLMLLFIFVTFQEITDRIGSEKMRRLFFHRPE